MADTGAGGGHRRLAELRTALNPDEMVWAWSKYGRLANLTPANVTELRDQVLTELEWAAFDGELLSGFFNHAHLGVQL